MQTKFKGKIPRECKESSRFVKAVDSFLKSESFLLENDLNERTISHKLAEYLQKEFPKHKVDCEYNRMCVNNSSKEIKFKPKRLNLQTETVGTDDEKGSTVFPDIIIHKRGNNKKNVLVIEIKKKNNNQNKSFDYEKLKAFTTQLNYTWGIYIEFNKTGLSDLTVFKNG